MNPTKDPKKCKEQTQEENHAETAQQCLEDVKEQEVEEQLIKGFMDYMKEQGAIAIIAERILIENENLLRAFEQLDFQKIASYQDFQTRI